MSPICRVGGWFVCGAAVSVVNVREMGWALPTPSSRVATVCDGNSGENIQRRDVQFLRLCNVGALSLNYARNGIVTRRLSRLY